MRRGQLKLLLSFICAALCGITVGLAPQREDAPVYEDIASIFEDNCTMCHNGPKAPKGLQLTSYERVLLGGSGGPVVVPGGPSQSELVKRLRGTSQPRMPLNGPPYLDDDEIALIERWIEGGAQRRAGATVVEPELPASESARVKDGSRFSDVAPIFKMRCVKCHVEGGLQGRPPEQLKLDSHSNVIESRERARVVPGSPDASELVRRIRGQAFPRMPFDGPPYLTEQEIALIEAWVTQGAPDDSGRKTEIPVGARVRLHGQLNANGTLDGLPLHLTTTMEIKKRPPAGGYVEVRGRVKPNGEIAVERVKPK